MIIDQARLEAAFLLAQTALKNQDLPDFMKNRWFNALEKAKDKLIEQPYFAWLPDKLTIVSIPQRKRNNIFARFYQATETSCQRLDKLGFCQAFYEGFPCWHRAAFLLLGIYFGSSDQIETTAKESSFSV